MKLLLENWRKLLEGEVIQFPQQPKISEDDLQRVMSFEDEIANLLTNIYGNTSSIPINILELMDTLVNSVEETLKK
jgi:hypothetical protein